MENENHILNTKQLSWPSFWQFCKNPVQLDPENMDKKGRFLLRMLGLMFLVNFAQIGLMFGKLDQNSDEITKLLGQYYAAYPYPVFVVIVLLTVAIIPPILEEIIFRFPLRLRPIYFNFFGNQACITAGRQLWSWFILLALVFYLSIGNKVHLGWLFLAFMLVVTMYIWKNQGQDGRFYAGFPLFLTSLSLLFGMVHITNFDLSSMQLGPVIIYTLAVYVLGRAALGFVLAYVRMRLGLLYCILLHAANNFIAVSIILLAPGKFF